MQIGEGKVSVIFFYTPLFISGVGGCRCCFCWVMRFHRELLRLQLDVCVAFGVPPSPYIERSSVPFCGLGLFRVGVCS